jgi:16S rRNA processing protein RimM
MNAERAPRPKRPGAPRRVPPRPQPSEGHVAVGLVQRPWGIHGELKIEPMTDNADRFRAGAPVWIGGTRYAVESARPHAESLLVRLRGIRGTQAATGLRGQLVEVPEDDLPPLPDNTYYRHQLLGLEVRSTDGEVVGRVIDLLETGANDVIVVGGVAGELLVPAIDDVVQDVDMAAGRITIEMIEGLAPDPPKRAPQRRRRAS